MAYKLNDVILKILLLQLMLFVNKLIAYDKEITVLLSPGKKDCYYSNANVGDTIDIEYQVIDGGDLDVSFALLDPIGLIIVTDFKKSENIHRHYVQKEGDYRFCFDNSFSTFNRKTVFFELIIEKEGAQNDGDKQWDENVDDLTPDEQHLGTVREIMDYIGRIRNHLTKARQIQDMIRSHEARDRNLAEANFNKVNIWSFFQILAMIIVGLLQVFMLRSIFETNTRMTRFWRQFKS